MENKILLLSWYQIIGGIVGYAATGFLIYKVATSGHLATFPPIAAFSIILYSISMLSGYLLLQQHSLGVTLTYLNQFLQVCSFSIGGFNWLYCSGISMFLGVDYTSDLLLKLDFTLSSLSFNIGGINNDLYLLINILPVFILGFLERRRLQHEPN